jgi:hypothetical protein
MSTTNNKIEWTQIDNDGNGNPRYVCHFLNLLTKEEKMSETLDISEKYTMAVRRANKIGGRKFHNKTYGGGIVFQSYNIHATEISINELFAKNT